MTAELHLGGDALPPFAAGLPDAATITVGGLSEAVWGGLRTGWLRTDAALAAAAGPEGLLLAEGRAFGTGHAFDDHLRLPFSRPPAELRAAVAVLARLDAAVRSRPAGRPLLPPSTVV